MKTEKLTDQIERRGPSANKKHALVRGKWRCPLAPLTRNQATYRRRTSSTPIDPKSNSDTTNKPDHNHKQPQSHYSASPERDPATIARTAEKTSFCPLETRSGENTTGGRTNSRPKGTVRMKRHRP